MSVSVVICCHNKIASLSKVVRGLATNKLDYELILSDDNSTDGSIEWANKSKLFSKILHCGPSGGKYKLCKIRNRGVKESSNNHVIILDADCMPEENFIKAHLEILNMGKDPVLSVGFTNHYDEEGKDMIGKDHRFSSKFENGIHHMRWNDAFGGNIAFSKDTFYKIGCFDEDYDGEWGFEDLDFAFRASKMKVGIKAHPLSIARHLRHPIAKDCNASNLRGRNNNLFLSKHGMRPC